MALIRNRMGVLGKIGIGNDVRFFFETYLFFFAQVHLNRRLFLAASGRHAKKDQDNAKKCFLHYRTSPWRLCHLDSKQVYYNFILIAFRKEFDNNNLSRCYDGI